MTFYTLTINEHELKALGDLMRVSRAVVDIVGGRDSDYGQKILGLAEVIEDVVERAESESKR